MRLWPNGWTLLGGALVILVSVARHGLWSLTVETLLKLKNEGLCSYLVLGATLRSSRLLGLKVRKWLMQ